MQIHEQKIYKYIPGVLLLTALQWTGAACYSMEQQEPQNTDRERQTEVTIVGEQFHINGSPVYDGRTWTTSYSGEYPVEGLLMNARLVQGVFDDLNPVTREQ